MSIRRPALSLAAIIGLGLLTLVLLVVLYLATGAFSFSSTHAYAATSNEPGQTLFDQKCVACHTIGAGQKVGPDLKGITGKRDRDWLLSFITAPNQLIAQGDPIAQQLVQQYGLPMPNLGLSADDAKAVLAYIEAQSLIEATPALTTVQNTPPALTGDAGAGGDIFTGRMALQNGGPACLSCHNVSGSGLIGGGTVGKDLSAAYSTLGETAIGSLLKTTPFPMMKEVYEVQPLTDDEIVDVAAFLRDAGSTPSTSAQNPLLFFIISGVGVVLVIGIFQFLWRGRLAGVRRSLVKGGSK